MLVRESKLTFLEDKEPSAAAQDETHLKTMLNTQQQKILRDDEPDDARYAELQHSYSDIVNNFGLKEDKADAK